MGKLHKQHERQKRDAKKRLARAKARRKRGANAHGASDQGAGTIFGESPGEQWRRDLGKRRGGRR